MKKMIRPVLKSLALLLAAVLLAEGALRLAGALARPASASVRGKTVLCAGDSFVWGIGGKSFPEQLQEILDAKYGAGKFAVVNAGVPGSNSSQMLYSLPAQLERYHPAFVIALTGRNNVWNKSRPGLSGGGLFAGLRLARLYAVLQSGGERADLHGLCEPDTEPEGVGDFNRVRLDSRRLPWFSASADVAGRERLLGEYGDAADIYLKTGNAYAALEMGRGMSGLEPKSALGRVVQARAYALAGNYASAFAALDSAVKISSSPFVVQSAYCRVSLDAGFYEKALPYCAAAAQSAQDADSKADLIAAYAYSGRASEAAALCGRALPLFPGSSRLRLACAAAYVYDGDAGRGRSLAGSAPEFYEALNEAGRYRSLAAYAEEDAVSGGTEKLLQASRLLEQSGQFKLMERVLDKVLKFNPFGAEAYVRLGDLARRKCDAKRAGEFYARAMQAGPDYWGGYYAAGNLAARDGDTFIAGDLLAKALLLSPQKHKVYRQLARQSLAGKKTGEAFRYYAQALALSPYDQGLCKEAARAFSAKDWSRRFILLEKDNPDLALNPVFARFASGPGGKASWQDGAFEFSGGTQLRLKEDLLRAAALVHDRGGVLLVSSYPEEELPGALEAARESGAVYVSLPPVFAAQSGDRSVYFSYDNDHPATAGYRIMAERFAAALDSVLQPGKTVK